MPIEMPKGLPFSVDTWTPSSKTNKRHHFLTHAHKDHSSGITTHSSFPIYCTHLTRTLLLQQYPNLAASLFVGIEVGQSLTIHDPAGSFTVSAFDANHCPGANILVDPNGEIKLADFGMAKHINSSASMLAFKGSPYWMAPEVVMKTNGYSLPVDIWSLGCTILEMATSKPPWSQYEGPVLEHHSNRTSVTSLDGDATKPALATSRAVRSPRDNTRMITSLPVSPCSSLLRQYGPAHELFPFSSSSNLHNDGTKYILIISIEIKCHIHS